MKTLFCSLLLLSLAAVATTANGNTRPAHLRPSADSPRLGEVRQDAFLLAPAESVRLSDREKEQGWEAISFHEDLRGFVRRADLTKDLRVAPGAPVYFSANEDSSQLLTRAQPTDLFEIGRLTGDWVEVSFRKPLTAYVRSAARGSEPSGRVETTRLLEDEAAPAASESAPSSRRPVISNRSAIPSDGLLRSFQGHLSQPRSFFGRQPPYPFQMVDSSGNRIAYLDLGKLLITTPLEHFIGHEYEFYGKAEPIEGRRDFVIRVERMLRK